MHELQERDATEEEIEEEFDTVQEYRDKWNDSAENNIVIPEGNKLVVSRNENEEESLVSKNGPKNG